MHKTAHLSLAILCLKAPACVADDQPFIQWMAEGVSQVYYTKEERSELHTDFCYECGALFGRTVSGRVRHGCVHCVDTPKSFTLSSVAVFEYHTYSKTIDTNLLFAHAMEFMNEAR